MPNRRKFLQQSGALAIASIFLPRFAQAGNLFGPKTSMPIGLQLYTMGDLMISDPRGTLQKLAAIGYKQLESAGSAKGNYYGFTPKEFAAMVTDAGMHWRSAHIGGAPFSPAQIMKMAKTAEDSARIQKYMERMKDRPKTPNLKENYQQIADEAAAGGLSYVVCSSIPVNTMD